MIAILNAIGWIVNFIKNPFTSILNIGYGFFSFIRNFLFFRILDKISDINLWLTIFNSAKFSTAITFLATSVILVFISILGLLVRIFLSIKDKVSSVASGGGGITSGDVSINLFYAVSKSLGLYDALADTWALWVVGFLIPFLTLIGSVLYFKTVAKSLGFLSKLTGSMPKGYSKVKGK